MRFVVSLCALCACTQSTTHDTTNNLVGSCQPFTALVPTTSGQVLGNVVADDAYAYTVTNNVEDVTVYISRVPKTGGRLENLVEVDTFRVHYALAGGYLYYAVPETTVGPWQLSRLPLDGSGGPEPVIEASDFADLAARGSRLYFHDNTVVASIALDGSDLQIHGAFDRMTFLLPGDGALYWMRQVTGLGRQLWAFDLTTHQQTDLTGLRAFNDDHFAQNASALYWSEWDASVGHSHLMTLDKSDGAPVALATSTDDGMYTPVAINTTVVWQEFIGGGNSTDIYEIPAGGGDARVVVPENCTFTDFGDAIALDDTSIYFAGFLDDYSGVGSLWRGDL